MSICACRFDGDLTSKAHRDHHRAWEGSRPAPPPSLSTDEVLVMMVRQDDLEARLVECERRLNIASLPPTRGAQAILTRAAKEKRS